LGDLEVESYSGPSALKAFACCRWSDVQNFCGLLDGEVFPVDEREEFTVGLTEILERLADNCEGVAGVGGVGNADRGAEPFGGLQSTCSSSPVVGKATSSRAQQPRQRSLIVGGYITEPAPRCFKDRLEDVGGVS
jgi:hypothetical protein